ncbi:hypothetical protein DSOL_3529 [Desulfosporosinus metallidurans]|uniref:Uncharacterized protein n=1 Tax=Desulfosporosinus metallidurans TaxID=1888891 RepID=A0A1Q8QQC9_9FIRM|nr:hypothetical protein DSOL_3529 [Desulfosporosinus metallidurans]
MIDCYIDKLRRKIDELLTPKLLKILNVHEKKGRKLWQKECY